MHLPQISVLAFGAILLFAGCRSGMSSKVQAEQTNVTTTERGNLPDTIEPSRSIPYEFDSSQAAELIMRTVGKHSLSADALEIRIPEPCKGSLSVYDIAGQVVTRSGESVWKYGTYTFGFHDLVPPGWPSGAYFAKFETGDHSITCKFVFLR